MWGIASPGDLAPELDRAKGTVREVFRLPCFNSGAELSCERRYAQEEKEILKKTSRHGATDAVYHESQSGR